MNILLLALLFQNNIHKSWYIVLPLNHVVATSTYLTGYNAESECKSQLTDEDKYLHAYCELMDPPSVQTDLDNMPDSFKGIKK